MSTVAAVEPKGKVRRFKDTDELVGGVRRQIRGLKFRAFDEDPWVVDDMLKLRAELDAAILEVIASYRAPGEDGETPKYRWDDIGFALGITGAAACKRYAHKI